MIRLSDRKSKLRFEVSTEVRSGRKLRAIIVECNEYTATIRLKGTRQRLEIDWEGVYVLAAKKEANRVRAEKLAVMDHFDRARQLKVGESMEWHYAPLCNTMIRECLGDGFQVDYIVTNWEASFGYTLITRMAL